MTSINTALGATLRSLREDLDLNQVQTAHRAHMDPSSLCRIETGLHRCRPQILDSICAALDTTPRYVLTTAGARWRELNPTAPTTGSPLTDALAALGGYDRVLAP